MKVTLFTSNRIRHNYFISLLSNYVDQLIVIQESSTVLKNSKFGDDYLSKSHYSYFNKVKESEIKLFENKFVNIINRNIKFLTIPYGDLSKLPLNFFDEGLKSNLYVVYGSSLIKDQLLNFLISKKCINIHMGIAPYYRGVDCNFWALYDNNPHLVGSTIHYLANNIDGGDILYHAISMKKNNLFDYSMSCVMAAFQSICDKIIDFSIFNCASNPQDFNKTIRLSKKRDLKENTINNFFKKKINIYSKDTDINILKDPYIYK